MRLQLLRQTVREHVQLDVDDHRHVPVDWLRRHRSQHALRSRHCRLYRRHGKCPLFGIYMHVWTLAKQTTSIYWCYAYMVLRALILYRRRRIINHLLTYLLTYLYCLQPYSLRALLKISQTVICILIISTPHGGSFLPTV